MPFHGFSTAKVARLAGVHPNTVRRYEQDGFISPASRTTSNYRLFEQRHVVQLKLARLVMSAPWLGRAIRRASIEIVRRAATGDLPAARQAALRHQAIVDDELAQAQAAAQVLQNWATAPGDGEPSGEPLAITQTARLLHLTADTLRNWERNGLLRPARNPANQYRQYHRGDLDRLRVIRLLVRSGYSLMAVLRAFTWLERPGQEEAPSAAGALDTPLPGEEVYTAADRWLTALDGQRERAAGMLALLDELESLPLHSRVG